MQTKDHPLLTYNEPSPKKTLRSLLGKKNIQEPCFYRNTVYSFRQAFRDVNSAKKRKNMEQAFSEFFFTL